MSSVILGTGSYDSVKSGNMVSITGDGGVSFGYTGPAFKKLAPKLATYTPYAEQYQKLLSLKEDASRLKEYLLYRKKIEDEYIKSYYESRLKNLRVTSLLKELMNRFGDNIILLCHEPVDEFCHRRLVADYIELETGQYIPEVEISSDGMVKQIRPIRYKNRLRKVMEEL